MKNLLYLVIPFLLFSCASKESINNNSESYHPIPTNDVRFNYVNSNSFISRKYLDKIESKIGNKYLVLQVSYSWGKTVESLYRSDNGNIMYYDKKSNSDNLIMPNDPKVGFIWYNNDKSWEYEIVDLNASLETPTNKYSKLLVMRATQIANRDSVKLKEYLNYYQKGIGQIASFGNGKLMTYRL